MLHFVDFVLRLIFGIMHALPDTDMFAYPGSPNRRHSPQRRAEEIPLLLFLLLTILRSPATPLLLLLPERRQEGDELRKRPGNSQADRAGPRIGELADSGAPGDGDGSEAERETPLLPVQGHDLEGLAADEDDEHLPPDHDGVDDDEEPVARDALEDVEAVVQAAVAELVEDLQPDERVEDQRVEPLRLVLVVGNAVSEQRGAPEVEDEGDGELADNLAHDHLAHPSRDEWGRLPVRFSVQDAVARRVGGER